MASFDMKDFPSTITGFCNESVYSFLTELKMERNSDAIIIKSVDVKKMKTSVINPIHGGKITIKYTEITILFKWERCLRIC
ncbi:hypothetical protein [Plasmodium yoelii yoelii]|uniref:Uncharacterized protein n=1 Tax=Plasmodium yoelii yoelii TaxID=73239 RepID=Q7RJB6_PLAYO|nr:hypothetical protein [Plasmodium yoelii yoelii]